MPQFAEMFQGDHVSDRQLYSRASSCVFLISSGVFPASFKRGRRVSSELSPEVYIYWCIQATYWITKEYKGYRCDRS